MRYLKLVLIALVIGYLVFELVINLPALNATLAFQIGLPWYPLGQLSMPTWVAMLGIFILAFIIAVVLEVAAWYEYNRVIRLQRLQIKALQKALSQNSPGARVTSLAQKSPSPSSAQSEPPNG